MKKSPIEIATTEGYAKFLGFLRQEAIDKHDFAAKEMLSWAIYCTDSGMKSTSLTPPNGGEIAVDENGFLDLEHLCNALGLPEKELLETYEKRYGSKPIAEEAGSSLQKRIKTSKRRYKGILEILKAAIDSELNALEENNNFDPSLTFESSAFRLIQEGNKLRALLEVEDDLQS